MKKIIGVIIIVVVIACAAVFFAQKKVEDRTRECLALIPEPYELKAEDISYSLLSNTLTLSNVYLKGRVEPENMDGMVDQDVAAKLKTVEIFFSGNIEEIRVSGFDAFASEDILDKPGVEIAEHIVLKNYSFELKPGDQLKTEPVKGVIREAEYKNVAMRSDVSINQLVNSKDLFNMTTMLESEFMLLSDTTADIAGGLTVSLQSATGSNYKNGVVAEIILKNYKAEAYGQMLFNLGEITITDLNYFSMLNPSWENPPLTGFVATNVMLSPLLSGQALNSIGAIEAKMDGDAVKRFTLNIRDMDVSRSVADRNFGDFKGMGYPEFIRVHGNANLDVNPEQKIMQIHELGLGFQDGFDANLELGDCRVPLKPFLVNPNRAMNNLGSLLTLRKAVLTIVDHSFMERFKKTLTPEDRQAVQAFFTSDVAPKKILDGLATQFEKPGTLTISLEAPNPMSADELSVRLENGTVPASWFSVVNSSTPAAGE